MVFSWPERMKDAGALRSQFTHCIDIGPTSSKPRYTGTQGR